MALKHTAFATLVALPAFVVAGSVMAGDVKWGSPNVPGQPGYKEPQKVEEVRAPRPVKDLKYGSGYQMKRTEDAK
ncbi:hypothetical protein [Methylocystis echinoides]|uniref:hypothetical protein n=1 Tax=Methylocystis echinoides TaxID=29468 RepID=UPI0034429158